MHRATPLQTSFRAHSSGGARSVVHEVDDSKLMQESKSNFMRNETRQKIESPQNYGFTSVTADGDKDGKGNLKMGPEAFVSFIGGNRSFPVIGIMDDRRHRLLNLIKDAAKGSTAMFGLKEWGQQLLNTDTGMFMTGNIEKKIRIALVENQNGKTQTQSSTPGAKALARSFRSASGVEFDIETFEGGGDGTSGSQQQGNSKPTGQKTLHKEQSQKYIELTKDKTDVVHDQSLNYKSAAHTFHPPDGGTTRAGGPLVTILGDKFTQGFGEFTKQVTAAAPTLSQHLTTKGYVDALIASLQGMINGITSSKGQPNGYATLDSTGKVPVAQLPSLVTVLVDRVAALEAEVASLKAGNA